MRLLEVEKNGMGPLVLGRKIDEITEELELHHYTEHVKPAKAKELMAKMASGDFGENTPAPEDVERMAEMTKGLLDLAQKSTREYSAGGTNILATYDTDSREIRSVAIATAVDEKTLEAVKTPAEINVTFQGKVLIGEDGKSSIDFIKESLGEPVEQKDMFSITYHWADWNLSVRVSRETALVVGVVIGKGLRPSMTMPTRERMSEDKLRQILVDAEVKGIHSKEYSDQMLERRGRLDDAIRRRDVAEKKRELGE